MLEMTAALHFSSNTVGKWVFGAIKAAPSTAILQHLHLDGLWLGSSHILEVASGLSSLISLACLIKRSAPTVEAIPKSEHPSKLYAKFFSPNSCFKKLRVLNSARVSAVEVAIIAMQIAVACPRFVLVDFPSRLRKGFSREVSWATYNEPFKPYADSIRRLI
ncbi:hypothetical protein IWW57_000064 [Coemansia sp. S610]|nr:hypothetical protein IWW57_000064 [Coemansia sp. S610]